MPYVKLDKPCEDDIVKYTSLHDGIIFAHTSVQFASLALKAKDAGWSFPQCHLYALAIELAFKSLALRSGASVDDCQKTGHDPGKMIGLIERHGTTVSARLKSRLSDKTWFKAFLLMSRYPAFSKLNTSEDNTIFLHPDYPEMIAEILETNCKWPLLFERGDALAEIRDPPRQMCMFKHISIRTSL